MQTHELPPAAALLDQYVQHFAGTIAPRLQTPAREALRRVNCELGATRTTRPLSPRSRAERRISVASPARAAGGR